MRICARILHSFIHSSMANLERNDREYDEILSHVSAFLNGCTSHDVDILIFEESIAAETLLV